MNAMVLVGVCLALIGSGLIFAGSFFLLEPEPWKPYRITTMYIVWQDYGGFTVVNRTVATVSNLRLFDAGSYTNEEVYRSRNSSDAIQWFFDKIGARR